MWKIKGRRIWGDRVVDRIRSRSSEVWVWVFLMFGRLGWCLLNLGYILIIL